MADLEFDFKNKKIGIIGGNGAMGKWFAQYFKSNGFKVHISDLKTELSNKKLAVLCDIVIISTPMDVAADIVKEIGELLSSDKLIMDICSLKSEIVQAMLKHTSCNVIGCHPMFGQYTKNLKGQNFVLCPGRGGQNYLKKFENLFASDGANVSISTPEKHDKYMAIVQGVTHLLTIATGEFLKSEGITPQEILNYSTPVFRLNLGLIGRLFGLDVSLYKELVGRNPMTQAMMETFFSSIKDSADILLRGKDREKIEFLKDIQAFFIKYSPEALEETNSIFNYLYEKEHGPSE